MGKRFATLCLLWGVLLSSGRRVDAAIAKVRDLGINSGSSATVVTITIPPGGAAAGDTVVVEVAFEIAPVTVTDSKANVYTADATYGRVAIFSSRLSSSLVAGDTVMVTHPMGGLATASAQEFAGLLVPAFDRSATGGGGDAHPITAPSATTSVSSELLVGAVAIFNLDSSPPSFAAGALYAPLPSAAAVNPVPMPGSYLEIAPEYRIVTTAGSFVADGILLYPGIWSAVLATYRGTFTPGVSVGDASAQEGGLMGTTTLSFPVTLSGPSTDTVSVQWSTADGTALAGPDYVAVPLTTLTFNPGETSKPAVVTLVGDKTCEPNETFFVNLSSPVNVVVLDGQGTGTILNDDEDGTGPTVSAPAAVTVVQKICG